MKTFQKFIIGILAVIAIAVGVVCVYALKVADDAKDTVDNISTNLNRETRKVSTAASDPISFVLLGIDEGTMVGSGSVDDPEENRMSSSYQGRSDSMMYVTINPQKKQTTMVSLDRDLDIKIVGKTHDDGSAYYSKLNAAYAFGAAAGGKDAGATMAIETIEELLDVPADHYISINMQGLEDLIDAVGGIDVNNPYHFELDGVELYPGEQHLDGKQGLAYARYREYDSETGMGDPEGDVGRQKRQREVIQLIVNKVLSLGTISNYEKIFKAIEKNVTTDLTWDDMLNIAEGYSSVMDNYKTYQLQGQYYWRNETYYQIPGINALLDIQNVLKEQLGLTTATTLPNLSDLDDNSMFFDDMHITMDAGARENIDPYLYWDGPILKPEEAIWMQNLDENTSYPDDFAY